MTKRLFDIIVSLVGLIILSPVFLLLGFVIKLDSPGPIFYNALRVGRGGQTFKMIKFRTMIPDADTRGPLVTAGDDIRVTRVGRLLRKMKLDELPTFWNVLLGDMSVVGPRPENPKSAALYTNEQRLVLSVRPGVTSLASIKYRHEEDLLVGADNLDARYFQIMQDKLRLELEYVKRNSLFLDLSIIAGTIAAIVKKRDP